MEEEVRPVGVGHTLLDRARAEDPSNPHTLPKFLVPRASVSHLLLEGGDRQRQVNFRIY